MACMLIMLQTTFTFELGVTAPGGALRIQVMVVVPVLPPSPVIAPGYKLLLGRFLLDFTRKGFSVRPVRYWNNLPAGRLDCPMLDSFKTA